MRLTFSDLFTAVLLLQLVSRAASAAKLPDNLPPNWRAGGTADTAPRKHSQRQPRSQLIESTDVSPENQSQRWTIEVNAGAPELLRMDLRYRPSNMWAFGINAAPGWPFDITVEMPSDVIQSDESNTLAVAYTAFDANFKASWGPHLSGFAMWHPLSGAWYIGTGLGYRILTLKGSANSQLRVCTVEEAVKEPPCGNNQASIQTRNHLDVSARLTMQSTMVYASTGWVWDISRRWNLHLGLGATKALTTKTRIDVEANIVDPDGTPQEVSGSLAQLKVKSEQDLASKAEQELSKFTTTLLPVAVFGIGYKF